MAKYFSYIHYFAIAILIFFSPIIAQYQSVSGISSQGWQFVPVDGSLPPILTYTAKSRLYCNSECNKRSDCRTFDYDGTTHQCRLWDADTSTGSIVATPSKPQSFVGSIKFAPSLYTDIYNQSCDKCILSRYLTCNKNSNTCQCPSKTYWDGSMCLAQRLRNQTCTNIDACRSDLNLTCEPSCDFTYRCLATPSAGVGLTVAGFCNGTIGSGSTALSGPWGIYVSPLDGTLYIADWDLNNFQAYSVFTRTGIIVQSTGILQALDIFADSSGYIYMVDGSLNSGTVLVAKNGTLVKTIPTAGQSTVSCHSTGLYAAYGIAVDESGNIYVSMYYCYAVTKWTLNSTNGTTVAGQLGVQGSSSTTLGRLRFIHLNENQNAIYVYVSDFANNRIQKFTIGGNGVGTTVAGTGVAGTGLNQLNQPAGIWVTRDGQTLYVADCNNNRVMKWTIGATQGSLVAGSLTGSFGSTSQLFNQPADVALDPTETYLYVSDYGNHRVQRFRVA